MEVGFTGTKEKLTIEQVENLKQFLSKLHCKIFHHGDCIGADAIAHKVAIDCKYKTIIHPPINEKYRAFCKGDLILETKPYIERNHDIINSTNCLLACPKGEETVRSGTWATIRYAKKKKKMIYIFNPNGTIEEINSDGERKLVTIKQKNKNMKEVKTKWN